MTIFGLNSPELFLILAITLVILGTKRIEKGLDLFSKLLKFLLSNQSSIEKKDKKKELTKEVAQTKGEEEELEKSEKKINAKDKDLTKGIKDAQEKEEASEKSEKKINAKEKALTKGIKETQKKEKESEKRLKIAKVDFKERKLEETKESDGIVKDKTVIKSKDIDVPEEQLDK